MVENRICSHGAKAVRHSTASVERRRTSCLASTSFFHSYFARLTPELRLARRDGALCTAPQALRACICLGVLSQSFSSSSSSFVLDHTVPYGTALLGGV